MVPQKKGRTWIHSHSVDVLAVARLKTIRYCITMRKTNITWTVEGRLKKRMGVALRRRGSLNRCYR